MPTDILHFVGGALLVDHWAELQRDRVFVRRAMGCPGAQGWLYSKAVSADEVTLLLDHIYPHS